MDIVVPAVGESVFEALVAKWHRQEGDVVPRDELLCEIETDKITLEIRSEAAGTLHVRAPEGTTVKIGAVIGVLDEAAGETAAAPPVEPRQQAAPAKPAAAPPRSPAARKQLREKGMAQEPPVEPEAVPAPAAPVGGAPPVAAPAPPVGEQPAGGAETRKPMTPIRRRIAQRLLEARQQTAMLTTFAEADLGRILDLRRTYGEQFQRRHGVKLGLMPFFVRACCEALAEYPAVNARIDGDELVYHHYCDIGIAVAGEKGLVVPVLRGADRLRFAEIETGIRDLAEKVRDNRLALADLEGGTFTITNGGVFGSLMSTPILNPPQSGVLGMHAVQERPVAREGEVVIRPMMYLALSYDHRIIDGREAVLFLKKVREGLEEPESLLLE